MRIQYLLDLKEALKDIPNEVLQEMGYGVGEDSEQMDLCIWANDYDEKMENFEKYPQLEDITKFMNTFHKAQSIMENQEPEECEQFENMEEPLSSDYKFEEVKQEAMQSEARHSSQA